MSATVASFAEDFTARAAARGVEVSTARLWNAASAALYLLLRGLRLPLTLGQARALDPMTRRQVLTLCFVWKEWGNERAVAQCERAIELVTSVDKDERDFVQKFAPAPICGWEKNGPRGIYTKGQWRRAS